MTDHQLGHIKHDPTNQQVAIRTQHDELGMRWVIATAMFGARNASDQDVETWADLHVPES